MWCPINSLISSFSMIVYWRTSMFFRITFLMGIILIVSSCGYHLRGAIDLPEEMKNIYVQNASPELLAGFRETIQFSAGNLVASPAEAGMIVRVIDEDMDRRVLSLTATGKANEYKLDYLLDFELLDAEGGILMPKQTIELNRSYFTQQINVIGKAYEEQVIREEMYRQAVNAIVSRARVAFR